MWKACDEYAAVYESVAAEYEQRLQEYLREYDREYDGSNWSPWRGGSGEREGFLRDCIGCCTEHAEVKEKALAVVRSWANAAIGRGVPVEIERIIDEVVSCRQPPGMVELSRYEWAWNGVWSGPGLYWLSTIDTQGAYCSTQCGEFSTAASGRWLDGSTVQVVKYWGSGPLPRRAVDVLYKEEDAKRRGRCVDNVVR